ncbi:MAG: glycosyltransferase [Candidatus Desulfacyla sp.]
MKKVSLVVPSYNHGEYIEACLDSIFFQDYGNIEIIVVDDCSNDDTREILHYYAKKVTTEKTSYAFYYDEKKDMIARREIFRYPQEGRELRIIHNDHNMGATRTYNRGLKEASGEYCSFVASDDICHPLMISELARILDAGLADFVYGDMFIIDDRHRILREFKLPDYSFEASFCSWFLCGVATLYRRELHDRFGYYDENAAADDHECYLRFARNGARFYHIPKVLYSVRSHAQRNVGLHAPDSFSKLLQHSKQLVLEARRRHADKYASAP